MSKRRLEKPKRRFSFKKIAAVLLTLILLGAASVLIGGYMVKSRLESKIATEPLISDYERPTPPVPKALNILVMGSDTRAGENGKGIGGETPGLSDTAILLHISQNRKFSYGVSIPRDSMVNIPSCPSKTTGKRIEPRFDMFNSAFATGGAPCTLKTVETLTGVRVNHFAVIDFSGFREVVDSLGGVKICVPEEVNDSIGKIHLDKGTYLMDGKTALDYVRVRHGLGAELGDIGRMRRQQHFASVVMKKALDQNILFDPVKSYKLASTVAENLTTDESLADLQKMVSLASSVQGIGMKNIKFFTVPFEPWPEDPNRLIWTDKADLVWESMAEDKKIDPSILRDQEAASPGAIQGPTKPKPATGGDSNGIC